MQYIDSILLGFSLAAIPGPIFFEVFRRTLTKGFWSGALLAVGEFLGNFLILILTFFGIQNFLSYPIVKSFLFIIGGLILLWVGFNAMRIKKQEINQYSKNTNLKNNSILIGFSLSVSSPLAIAVWISIGGAYLAKYSSKFISLINMFLLAFGVMLFFFCLALFIHFTKHKISTRYIILFSRIFGFILLVYGFYFLYRFLLLVI